MDVCGVNPILLNSTVMAGCIESGDLVMKTETKRQIVDALLEAHPELA
jgi:hypothetical protein